jgi:plastocyanin
VLGLCAVVASALLTAAGGPLAAAFSSQAPRAGCEWHRHGKRVVRHLRRNGRRRRVTRVQHWWTCDPQPPAPVAEPPTPGPPLEPPPAGEEAPPPPVSHLGVRAVEWNYTLSRPEVPAGEVIVELNNQGEDNHNLKIVREGGSETPLAVPEAAPGQQTTARVSLGPGTYTLYCSLYEHEKKGMQTTLVVGEAPSP